MGEQAAATFNFACDIVERWAQLRPRDLALWCVDEEGAERRFTFGELNDQFRRAAHLFHQGRDSARRSGARDVAARADVVDGDARPHSLWV